MTHNDEFIGQLESYLDEYEGSTPLPEEVRDAIRAELPSTQQRPPWWPARRLPHMNTIAKIALTAAAIVTVALLGVSYFAGRKRRRPRTGAEPDKLFLTVSRSPFGRLRGASRRARILPRDPFRAPLDVQCSGWLGGQYPCRVCDVPRTF